MKGVTRRRLKEVRESFGWSREKLAKKLNVTPQVLANMELGRKQIYADDLIPITQAFGITISQFYGDELEGNQGVTLEETEILKYFRELSDSQKEVMKDFLSGWIGITDIDQDILDDYFADYNYDNIPYYDDAASMGTGNYVQNAVMEKIEVPSDQVPPGTDFAIRVVGDSMEPTFHSGDRLYIHKTDTLEPGEIGVFNIEGEQFVKEYQPGMLVSHNKDYPPMQVKTRDSCIQGKVLGKIKDPAVPTARP